MRKNLIMLLFLLCIAGTSFAYLFAPITERPIDVEGWLSGRVLAWHG